MVAGDVVAQGGEVLKVDMATHQAELGKIVDEVGVFAKTLGGGVPFED